MLTIRLADASGNLLPTNRAAEKFTLKVVTAFTLAFLVYNLKVFWAWIVDGVRLPVIGRLGQRVSWMLVAGVLAGAVLISSVLFWDSVRAIWLANLGAVEMARVELWDFPTDKWDDGSDAESLRPATELLAQALSLSNGFQVRELVKEYLNQQGLSTILN